MPDSTTTLATLKEAVRQFAAEREWQPFHSPKNLSMGLAVDATVFVLAAGLLAGTDRACGQGMDGPDLMASSPAVLPPDVHLQDMVAALPAPAAANPNAGKREVIAVSEAVPQLPPPAVERPP